MASADLGVAGGTQMNFPIVSVDQGSSCSSIEGGCKGEGGRGREGAR